MPSNKDTRQALVYQTLGMIEEGKTWTWNEDREAAAHLVAGRQHRYQDIADIVGVSTDTLSTWRKRPEFQDRVGELRAERREELLRDSLTQKQERLAALAERHQELTFLKAARGRQLAERAPHVPGSDTGWVVETPPSPKDVLAALGAGVAPPAPSYSTDFALLKELREIERQIAYEEFNWVDNKGNIDLKIEVKYDEITTPEELKRTTIEGQVKYLEDENEE